MRSSTPIITPVMLSYPPKREANIRPTPMQIDPDKRALHSIADVHASLDNYRTGYRQNTAEDQPALRPLGYLEDASVYLPANLESFPVARH